MSGNNWLSGSAEKANTALKGGFQFARGQLWKRLVNNVMGNAVSGDDSDLGNSPEVVSREWARPPAGDAGHVLHAAEFSILEEYLAGVRSEEVRKEFASFSEDAYTSTEELRIWVGTYNVNGRKPPEDISIEEWFELWDEKWPQREGGGEDRQMKPGADMYIVGFQEVIPLNAQNIISGGWNSSNADAWDRAIDKQLNPLKRFAEKSISSASGLQETSTGRDVLDLLNQWSGAGTGKEQQSSELPLSNGDNQITKVSDRSIDQLPDPHDSVNTVQQPLEKELSFGFMVDSKKSEETGNEGASACASQTENHEEYAQIISKQLVGLHLSVWVRRCLLPHIKGVQTTSVATGALGYLANKGAIAARMRVYDSSFALLTSHFASGEGLGDEVRRNLDYSEIVRRAVFPFETVSEEDGSGALDGLPDDAPPEVRRLYKGGCWGANRRLPDHENVVWCGDLNYRIAGKSAPVVQTIRSGRLHRLYDLDQLSRERAAGRVFQGWREGPITFAPTYKYVRGTDYYTGERDEESSSSSEDEVDSASRDRYAQSEGDDAASRGRYGQSEDPMKMSIRSHPVRDLDSILTDSFATRSTSSNQSGQEREELLDRLNLSTRGSHPADTRPKVDVQRFASERMRLEARSNTPSGSPRAGQKKKLKKPKKIRVPSWTDRILYYSSGRLHHLLYGRGEMVHSDHKPVAAAFLLQARSYDRQAVENCLGKARKVVDDREMASIPRCSLHPSVLEIGSIRYRDPRNFTVHITNSGEVPAVFAFIPPPNPILDRTGTYVDKNPFPEWMSVEPLAGHIEPGEGQEIRLTVRIQGGIWGSANELADTPDCSLDAIMVLRVEGGSDYFVSVSGTYSPSCFGLSLEQLAARRRPNKDKSRVLKSTKVDLASMRHRTKSDPLELDLDNLTKKVTPAGVQDATASRRNFSPFVSLTRTGPQPNLVEGPIGEMVPSQVARMLFFLCQGDRLRTEGLFVDGLQKLLAYEKAGKEDPDVVTIRHCLDSGEEFPIHIGPEEACKALLAFFRDLPTPLIPESVAQACEQSMISNNIAVSLTKEAMSAIEWGVMRTTLEIMRTALTEEYVDANKLTVEDLASVLANVWFQPMTLASDGFSSRQKLVRIAPEESIFMERRTEYMTLFLQPQEESVSSLERVRLNQSQEIFKIQE